MPDPIAFLSIAILEKVQYLTSYIAPLATLTFTLGGEFFKKEKEYYSFEDVRDIKKKRKTLWGKINIVGLVISSLLTFSGIFVNEQLKTSYTSERVLKDSLAEVKNNKTREETENILKTTKIIQENLIKAQDSLLKGITSASIKLDQSYQKQVQLQAPLFPIELQLFTYTDLTYADSRAELRQLYEQLSSYDDKTLKAMGMIKGYNYVTYTADTKNILNPVVAAANELIINHFLPAINIDFCDENFNGHEFHPIKQSMLSLQWCNASPGLFPMGEGVVNLIDYSIMNNRIDVTYSIAPIIQNRKNLTSIFQIPKGSILLESPVTYWSETTHIEAIRFVTRGHSNMLFQLRPDSTAPIALTDLSDKSLPPRNYHVFPVKSILKNYHIK